ncbi:hypothetical protein HAX54_005906, partial [Datura stramonium]|nr:hypothetical protein [Datura stramonium]
FGMSLAEKSATLPQDDSRYEAVGRLYGSREDPWFIMYKSFSQPQSPPRAIVCGYDPWPEVVKSFSG